MFSFIYRRKGLIFIFFFIFGIWLRTQGIASDKDNGQKAPYLDLAEKILKEGLKEEQAFAVLKKLTGIGPRLTGSPQAAAAVELIRQEMQNLGLENIHLEPTVVEHWIRGAKEKAKIVSARYGTIPLSVCALGGSIATPETGISAEVVEVQSFTELQKIKEKAQGKIIFFNRPMDPTILNTFDAYGKAVDQRVRGAVEAAKVGAVAALVRSPTTRLDDFPHTGLMRYDPQVPKIPAACVSTKGAELLSQILKKDSSTIVFMKLDCRNLPHVTSYNVLGQITGSEKPNEIILIGGHLDSWDLGTGAHDDGAGCAHALEALRLIKELGLKPKRTIRAVMFMDEEFGGIGGKDYAQSENRREEVHLAAIESDRGAFLPLGFGVGADLKTIKRLQRWEYLFKTIGLCWIRGGGGGVDISPLAKNGAITIGLIPDCQRYFDVHHSGRDVLEMVNPRELELGAVAIAIFSYVLAQEGIE